MSYEVDYNTAVTYMQAKLADRAFEMLVKALSEVPDSEKTTDNVVYFKILMLLSRINLEKAKRTEAIKFIDEGLSVKNDHADLLFYKALYFWEEERYEEMFGAILAYLASLMSPDLNKYNYEFTGEGALKAVFETLIPIAYKKSADRSSLLDTVKQSAENGRNKLICLAYEVMIEADAKNNPDDIIIMIPPRKLRRSGGDVSGYLSGGQLQLQWLRKYAGLNGNSDLLDVGCGDGRLAYACSSFIKEGTYSSFDVNLERIEFLDKVYLRKYDNFSFKYADLWHSYYNPSGKFKTTEYIFPYKDDSFDIVFLNSIFSHFLPEEINHYLTEIDRVLRPGGTVLATYFIACEESIRLDNQGLSNRNLVVGGNKILNHRYDNYWTRDHNVKERLIAVDEEWLKQAYVNINLDIAGIIYGTWCGREQNPDEIEQDIVIARKK